MEHHFNVTIAQKYNINIATFLHNIAFWTQHNIANRKNFHDGLYWTYNSYEAFTVLFPYWSYKQIKLIIANCEEEGLLVRGNYNKSKFDKTNWYALTQKGLDLYNLSISPNGLTEEAKRADGTSQMAPPIPDSNPDSNPTTTKQIMILDDKVFTEKLKQEFLDLRREYGDDQDDRSDEEFLNQCRFHLEHNSGSKFTVKQSIKGMKTIIKQGFCTPAAYLEMLENIKKAEERRRRVKKIEEKSLGDFYKADTNPVNSNRATHISKLLETLKKGKHCD